MAVVSQESQRNRTALVVLEKRMIGLILIQMTLTWMGYQSLLSWWTPQFALRWLGITFVSSIVLLGVIWNNLEYNHPKDKQELLASLGAGNVLTIVRGSLICFMAGFLFSPWPRGWVAWLPGLLYALAALADLFDGYLARRYNHVTRFGELLDMRLDGLGVLIGCLLLVQYGQVPAWYLLVGLARYLFLFGIWLRRRFGKPIHELTPNLTRRPFAGLQMGFIAVVLFPVFSPPGTVLIAALFATPFLVGFALDWMAVSGIGLKTVIIKLFIRFRVARHLNFFGKQATRWIPVVIRFLVVILLVVWLVNNLYAFLSNSVVFVETLNKTLSFPDLWLGLAYILMTFGLVFITLGAAGRLAALFVLFGLGLFQYFSILGLMEIGLLVSATLLVFSGTGPFSLWVPEKNIIMRRLGEV